MSLDTLLLPPVRDIGHIARDLLGQPVVIHVRMAEHDAPGSGLPSSPSIAGS